MNKMELLHILALLKVEGVGDIVAKKLINHCGSAEEVFKSKSNHLKSIDGIGSVLLHNLKDKTVFEKAEQELKYIESENVTVLYYQDANYPKALLGLSDFPPLLYVKGELLPKDAHALAVVGTRSPTTYGATMAHRFSQDLARAGFTIVSGLFFSSLYM